jgi:hypothetical protein
MEEDLEGVSEVDEVLVVGGEEDGFLPLRFREVEAEDVVQEEVGLRVRGKRSERRERARKRESAQS